LNIQTQCTNKKSQQQHRLGSCEGTLVCFFEYWPEYLALVNDGKRMHLGPDYKENEDGKTSAYDTSISLRVSGPKDQQGCFDEKWKMEDFYVPKVLTMFDYVKRLVTKEDQEFYTPGFIKAATAEVTAPAADDAGAADPGGDGDGDGAADPGGDGDGDGEDDGKDAPRGPRPKKRKVDKGKLIALLARIREGDDVEEKNATIDNIADWFENNCIKLSMVEENKIPDDWKEEILLAKASKKAKKDNDE
jgi:hypothetical protein